MQYNKEKIVKAIEEGLVNSYIEKRQLNLPISNHQWVNNYNFIFSKLLDLDGNSGLHIKKFNRQSYNMAAIYDENNKTLFTICSENCFAKLRKRSIINSYHYSDAYSLLSIHQGEHIQTNMFGEEVKIESNEDLQALLKKLMINFSNNYDIQEYCILACRFDHKTNQLFSITGYYLAKNYEIIREDTTWNDLIGPNYIILDDVQQEELNGDLSVNVSVKDNLKLKFKLSKTNKENID